VIVNVIPFFENDFLGVQLAEAEVFQGPERESPVLLPLVAAGEDDSSAGRRRVAGEGAANKRRQVLGAALVLKSGVAQDAL